ncbi:MAG: flagellar filament capping protein FliD [Rickettsiales bacterium]|nr:flagellar filament capping protein FliD [Rickettsiales bacterium]
MVTQVTLGNFFNVNGRNVLGGIGGSGLDTESLIDGIIAARRAPAEQYEDQVTQNGKISSALSEFRSLLSAYQASVDVLRNPPGVGNEAQNVFKYRTATATASDGTASANYVTVTAAPGATVQNYTIDSIEQLATYASQTTGTITADDANASVTTAGATAGKFKAGTITINDQEITLDVDDSLNEIASKFNAVSANTGINVTVIKIADEQYQLAFKATATGDDADFDLDDLDIDPDGVFAGVNLAAAVGAQNAQFYFNGIPTLIERQSNAVDDLINGMTFNLRGVYNTANLPNSKISVAVEPDTTLAQNSVVNFILAYNNLREFAVKQTQLNSDGTYAEDSVLANNQTFVTTMNNITSQITTKVAGLSLLSSLSDIGISFTTKPADGEIPEIGNILTTDDAKLSSALASNFEGVAELFGFNMTSNSTELKVYSAPKSLAVIDFTLNINPDDEEFTVSYDLGDGEGTQMVDLEWTELPDVGYTLTGPAGSAIEDLVFIYGSTDAAEIEVTATQGIAALAYNSSEGATEANDGTIAVEMERLKDNDTKLQEDIAEIDQQVNQYRELLISQFAALEKVIAQVNSLLQSLSANDDARIAANS